jgi:hypothetical protein
LMIVIACCLMRYRLILTAHVATEARQGRKKKDERNKRAEEGHQQSSP